MNIAIIPARGGSRRIPRKNIRPFHGKPIIAYSIDAAWGSGLFDQVIVSTDDDEVEEAVRLLPCRVHRRPPDLGRDDVGTLEVTADAARIHGRGHDFVCCIYATAPLITPAFLCRGLDSLKALQVCHCVAVGGYPLRDAGAFYWSRISSAMAEEPFYEYTTAVELLPEDRICDINTEADWARAEAMYAALHKEGA